MRTAVYNITILTLCLLHNQEMFSQYTVNGNANINNCHCYTLTPNINTQSGSVWNNFKINLSDPFDFNFNINLGCNDVNGADGIAFVLQPISTSVGSTGGGLGFAGIAPSVGVTIDTWQNAEVSDPDFDHIGIQLNGDINHANSNNNIAGPVQALAGSTNIEDCNWHTLRITWNTASKQLAVYTDGNLRVTITRDIIADVFGGDPHVFWGFTGSTGGAVNLQQFCTALSPGFRFQAGQKRCINEPVTFFDSTISFTTLQKRYWDFGDGSPLDSTNLNPVHTYTAAGDYTVTQRVIGADGCSEINTQTLRIGGKPIAAFNYTDSCLGHPINFSDVSTAPFGTIDNWYWDLGNGTSSVIAHPSTQYVDEGPKEIKLLVSTEAGCVSDTLVESIDIYSSPVIDYTFTDSVCAGSTAQFRGEVISSANPVQNWVWNFGAPLTVQGQNATFIFTNPGPHSVVLNASSASQTGCPATVSKTIFIRSKPIAAFADSFVCQSAPHLLTDTSYSQDGSIISRWWWQFESGQISLLQNPVVLFSTTDTVNVKLVVETGSCISDTLNQSLIVVAKPVADFGFTGNSCEGEVLYFSDSSVVNNGHAAQWQWQYKAAIWSTEKNTANTFEAGNQMVGLSVVSDKGCKSDFTIKTIAVQPKPNISLNSKDACINEIIHFSVSGDTGSVQNWQWKFGDDSTATVINPAYAYTKAGKYSILLSAADGNGCTTTDSALITIYASAALAEPDTIIASAGQPVHLYASGGINYEWLPAEGLNNASIANPVATVIQSRQYIVKAYTPVGCSSYDTVLIKILDGPEIYVPTAFNPISRVGNHMLRPVIPGITRLNYFTVYNRFGQIVFSTAIAGTGWDGRYKGVQQPAGAYVWVASAVTFRGNTVVKKGVSLLVR